MWYTFVPRWISWAIGLRKKKTLLHVLSFVRRACLRCSCKNPLLAFAECCDNSVKCHLDVRRALSTYRACRPRPLFGGPFSIHNLYGRAVGSHLLIGERTLRHRNTDLRRDCLHRDRIAFVRFFYCTVFIFLICYLNLCLHYCFYKLNFLIMNSCSYNVPNLFL